MSVSSTISREPGRELRKIREQLRLKYRDVEEASQKIATQHGNQEFAIGLSRLADIENKGTLPSIYRLYSLCAIYGVDLTGLLEHYGVDLQQMPADAARLTLSQTRTADFTSPQLEKLELPTGLSETIDLRRTSYVSRQFHRWGKLPLVLLNSLDLKRHRYAFIGSEDWSMHPIIRPGSFVQIDESKRRARSDGWSHENERPIFFLEHRAGFRCGWCSEHADVLVVQSHSSSPQPPEIYKSPGEAEIIGQVVGVAMRLDLVKKRHTRS